MKLLSLAFCLLSLPAVAADLSGDRLLVISIRTGDTEVFVADPTTGDGDRVLEPVEMAKCRPSPGRAGANK